jgi:hypothetical protein
MLGLSLLSSNPNLSISEKEACSMMDEAACFMSDTLNDVLSMHKVEEGSFSCEFGSFKLFVFIKYSLSIQMQVRWN